MLNKYADFFDVSVDFLLGRIDLRRKSKEVKEYTLNMKGQKLVDRST